MGKEEDLVEHFNTVTGAEPDRAKFFLEAAAWDLSVALDTFWRDVERPEDSEMPETNPPTTAEANPTSRSAEDPPSRSPGDPLGMLDRSSIDIEPHSDDDSDDEEEEEGQAYYAGGSQHSGQQVIGPPRKTKDVVAKLFKAAKRRGAEVVEGQGGAGPTLKASFQGTSYRLGETAQDTQVIPDTAPAPPAPPVELRLWRTGFTVDDGPLRGYQEEDSRRFMADIKSGRIPLELLRTSGGREVAINMSDHRHDDFVAAKQQQKAFSGSGQALGSPAPSVVGQVTHVAGPGGTANRPPAPVGDPSALVAEATRQLAVDAAQPTTSVQIRLTDGSRLVVRANHSHTVGDLRSYVTTARPQYAASQFALMTTFPHAELADCTQSLAAANILNSAIVVKIRQ